jgi:hypothetical protein
MSSISADQQDVRQRRRRTALQLLVLLMLVIVGCSSTPTPPENWSESFDSPDAWRMGSDAIADVAVTEGRLVVHIFEPGQVAWGSTQREWGDVHLAVTATQVSGPPDNEYGILLNMDDDQHFYAFSISGDGYIRAARYDEGVWTLLGSDWTPSEAINQGAASNVLEVVEQDGAFEFIVNEQSVIQVTADATGGKVLSPGSIGLYAGAFGAGDVVVAFDDLHVTPLP